MKRFLEFTDAGSLFVFGVLANQPKLGEALGPENGFIFAFKALPTIIFISSFFTVLYYFGILQFVVRLMARDEDCVSTSSEELPCEETYATTTYIRDFRGVVTDEETAVPGELVRSLHRIYDAEGIYPRRVRNVLGHEVETAVHPALGVVVATEDEETLIKSFRNIERVAVTVPSELEVRDLVWARSLLVSESALEAVEGRAN